MPRLRRARTPEEALAVPVDKPLVVQLGEAEEIEAPEKPDKPEQQQEPPERAAPEPEPELEPDEPNALQKQVADLRRAEEMQRQALAQRDAEIARLKRSQEDEAAKTEQAQYDAVVIALNAAQGELETAERELKVAFENGDTASQAAITRRIGVIGARVDRFEYDKSVYETRREQAQRTPSQPDIHARIDQMTHLSSRAREWLHGHPDVMTDAEKNARIGAYHYDAMKAGHGQDSEGYFHYIEERLGYRQPGSQQQTERTEPRRSPPVSAPVSRETPNLSTGRPQRRDIHLSAEQREAARIAGVDDFTYAKGVQELERRKKLGMYPDHG